MSTDRLRGRRGVERRQRWLINHPLCVRCAAKKPPRATLATTPDHIVALTNGGTDDESNLQSLCDACHELKTAEDLNYKPKMKRDTNGWLIPSR